MNVNKESKVSHAKTFPIVDLEDFEGVQKDVNDKNRNLLNRFKITPIGFTHSRISFGSSAAATNVNGGGGASWDAKEEELMIIRLLSILLIYDPIKVLFIKPL